MEGGGDTIKSENHDHSLSSLRFVCLFSYLYWSIYKQGREKGVRERGPSSHYGTLVGCHKRVSLVFLSPLYSYGERRVKVRRLWRTHTHTHTLVCYNIIYMVYI
jgi:hypothetical protein